MPRPMATCQSFRPSETGGRAPGSMVMVSMFEQTGSMDLRRPETRAVLER